MHEADEPYAVVDFLDAEPLAGVPVELAPSGPERAEDFAALRRCLLAKLGVRDTLAERDPRPRPANDPLPQAGAPAAD